MIEDNPFVHDMTINIERKIDKLHKAPKCKEIVN
jgi:hypothetical protein